MADADPHVAALLEMAERPRVQGWSMAAALMRYAQPQPALVGHVWRELRRVLWSLKSDAEAVEPDGPVLRAASELDELGDVLATWAADRAGERPDAQVEAVAQHVTELLDAAGVAHETREGPPRGRGGRGGRGV